jgi:N-carbamoyl-L-amino-acid hydrolase
MGVAALPLGSPASHDAANFAAAGIPTGLLLIRNAHGSHNPREAMETADLMAAAATFAAWLRATVAA